MYTMYPFPKILIKFNRKQGMGAIIIVMYSYQKKILIKFTDDWGTGVLS